MTLNDSEYAKDDSTHDKKDQIDAVYPEKTDQDETALRNNSQKQPDLDELVQDESDQDESYQEESHQGGDSFQNEFDKELLLFNAKNNIFLSISQKKPKFVLRRKRMLPIPTTLLITLQKVAMQANVHRHSKKYLVIFYLCT